MAPAECLPQLSTAEKWSLYIEYAVLHQRFELMDSCTPTQPSAGPTCHKRAFDASVHENLKAKDIRTVTFAPSDCPSNDVVSDVTLTDSCTTPGTQMGSLTTLPTNIDSVKETAAIAKRPNRFTHLQEPYSMIVQYGKDWYDVASVFASWLTAYQLPLVLRGAPYWLWQAY